MASTLSACGSICLLHPHRKIARFENFDIHNIFLTCFAFNFRSKDEAAACKRQKYEMTGYSCTRKTLFQTYKTFLLFQQQHSTVSIRCDISFRLRIPISVLLKDIFVIVVGRCDAAIIWGLLRDMYFVIPIRVSRCRESEGPLSKLL